MTKVLHVLGSLDHGGAEKVALDLCRAIPQSEVAQAFYCLSGREGVLVHSFRDAGAVVIAAQSGSMLRRAFELRRVARRVGADVVVSHVSLASAFLLLAVGSVVPVRIARFHSTGDGRSGVGRRIYRIIARLLLPLVATHVLGVSSSTLHFAMGRMGRVYSLLPIRAAVLVNGVDTARFHPRSETSRSRGVRVAHIGRASPEKNRALLPRVFSELVRMDPDAEMQVIGPGGTSDLVDAPVDPRFVMVGAVDDAADVLREVDVLLLPSFREGLPGVVLEALASGVPVVASDIATIRELCELPGLHLVSLDEHPAVWARAVIRAAAVDPQERLHIAESVGQSRFALDRSIRAWIEIWKADGSRH